MTNVPEVEPTFSIADVVMTAMLMFHSNTRANPKAEIAGSLEVISVWKNSYSLISDVVSQLKMNGEVFDITRILTISTKYISEIDSYQTTVEFEIAMEKLV